MSSAIRFSNKAQTQDPAESSTSPPLRDAACLECALRFRQFSCPVLQQPEMHFYPALPPVRPVINAQRLHFSVLVIAIPTKNIPDSSD
ncbi:hypothetical protein [Agrobacterium sp. NPDC090283]|uniref:hypothetical protein n=1 Tax=Agrobacterium sp. NPDC090283 TaxID=3363920 RepID=UPI00383B355F